MEAATKEGKLLIVAYRMYRDKVVNPDERSILKGNFLMI